jgi:auxin-responsive protein IAA
VFHFPLITCRENNRLAAAAAAASAVVGWPPVRAFRKNLSSAAKPADAADDALLSSKEKMGSEDGGGGERRPGMFVKVHLEGCAVGRKVDLQAHLGYGSLSRALRSMFLLPPGGQWRIPASADKDKDNEEQKVETTTTKKKTSYILLYEDNEGDRMLVGDVPWE